MPAAELMAALVLIGAPDSREVAPGSYVAVAVEGTRLLGAELAARFARAGAVTRRLDFEAPADAASGDDARFHWGRWFVAAARPALDEATAAGQAPSAIGYAGAGAVALANDRIIAALIAARPGQCVANNRFSGDAFVVAGDSAKLTRAIDALESCPSDNAAPRTLEASGFELRDLAGEGYTRFDVDTPLDLALLVLAGRLPTTRALDGPILAFLEEVRLPGKRRLEVPNLEAIGAVMRDRTAELLVAGRIPSNAWATLERDTACRVRCYVEERGMRSAREGHPRSILAAFMRETSPARLIAELASLADAVILDTRVLMAAVGGSAETDAWPPEEERFASDFGDPSRIGTVWLRELVEAARDAPIPFLMGGHALVSDGLEILLGAAWLGR